MFFSIYFIGLFTDYLTDLDQHVGYGTTLDDQERKVSSYHSVEELTVAQRQSSFIRCVDSSQRLLPEQVCISPD